MLQHLYESKDKNVSDQKNIINIILQHKKVIMHVCDSFYYNNIIPINK